MSAKIPIDRDQIAEFCRRWKIQEFALFGSVLRDDFGPDSDVDVLVAFEPDAPWSLFDLVDMEDELKTMFGHEVDLVSKRGLRNPFRRHEIFTTREVIYATDRPRIDLEGRHGLCAAVDRPTRTADPSATARPGTQAVTGNHDPHGDPL